MLACTGSYKTARAVGHQVDLDGELLCLTDKLLLRFNNHFYLFEEVTDELRTFLKLKGKEPETYDNQEHIIRELKKKYAIVQVARVKVAKKGWQLVETRYNLA